MRAIALCTPGTNNPFMTVALLYDEAGSIACVRASIAFFTDGAPTTRTNTTRRRYGDHARKICAGVYLVVAATTGVSFSRRMILFGCHRFSTATMTTMQVSELQMAVRPGPR